jgi:hypothetical protein
VWCSPGWGGSCGSAVVLGCGWGWVLVLVVACELDVLGWWAELRTPGGVQDRCLGRKRLEIGQNPSQIVIMSQAALVERDGRRGQALDTLSILERPCLPSHRARTGKVAARGQFRHVEQRALFKTVSRPEVVGSVVGRGGVVIMSGVGIQPGLTMVAVGCRLSAMRQWTVSGAGLRVMIASSAPKGPKSGPFGAETTIMTPQHRHAAGPAPVASPTERLSGLGIRSE